MFAQERQQHVLNTLARAGRVEVADLARTLGVSEDTVRRDLRALAARGVLHKTHGGAVSLDPGHMSWAAREGLRQRAKVDIGERAAQLVAPGQSLILDAGSTVLELARALRIRPLSVLTNSLDIASLFASDAEVSLSLTGGEWDGRARYLTGTGALAYLAQRRADWAFLGACALHVQAGLTSVSEADAAVKRAMLAAADRTVVLTDSSKAGQLAPYLVASLAQLHAVVTDDPQAARPFQAAGVQMLLAAEPAG